MSFFLHTNYDITPLSLKTHSFYNLTLLFTFRSSYNHTLELSGHLSNNLHFNLHPIFHLLLYQKTFLSKTREQPIWNFSPHLTCSRTTTLQISPLGVFFLVTTTCVITKMSRIKGMVNSLTRAARSAAGLWVVWKPKPDFRSFRFCNLNIYLRK